MLEWLANRVQSNHQDLSGFLTSSGIVRDTNNLLEPCSQTFSFFNLNNQRFVKYKNFVKQRTSNISSKPINITDPYEELENGLLDLYEKNVLSNTKISVLKDVGFFLILGVLIVIRFRARINKLSCLIKHLKFLCSSF